MSEVRRSRAEREVALAAFGADLEAFDDWVLDRLAALLDEDLVRAGQVLWSRGTPVEHLYFMQRGRVQSRLEGAPSWTFQGRWFLGGFEGRASRVAERDLVALDDFQALRIPRQGWLELLEDSFEMTRRTLFATATAVARLEERIPVIDGVGPLTPARPEGGALSMVERIAFLAGIEMVAGAGVQALADLASASDEIVLPAGELLLPAQDGHERLLFVVAGELDAARRSPDVERRYLRGEVVAGPAAFSDRGRDWTARARTAVRLLAIPYEAWFDLIEVHFELADAALAGLALQRDRILTRLASQAGPEGLVLT
jgi:CRP-like cAMP-binding protein